jgi:hypothetical protein
MQSNTIEYKVSVFISSKCGGKYAIIRKALKELLLETGMTNVYAFETAPGSSQPIPDAYLQGVDESHLCLFLIDNKDEVTDPVLAEYRRAKDLEKKIICFFCDEDEKKPTQLEEEIKATQSGKYKIVHEFSDITETAYKSVLQDILDVYKKKQNISVLSNTEGSSSVKTSIILSGNYIIDKNMFSGIDKTKSELIKIVNPFTEKEKDTSELDDLSSEFLKVILCKKKFDANEYGKLCEKVIELHLASYKDLISLRLKAVKYYYEDKITECIATLKDALRIASKNTEVANWVLNDIAINLRNIINISGEMNSRVSMNNEGQKFINDNCEPLFFPVLDRFENNMKEKIIKQYYKVYTDSPYTTTLGGQAEVFEDIAICYYTALIYGSITHLRITGSRVIDALSALCFEYSNHDIFVELIKMLILERRDKDLEKLFRIYNQSVDVVNSNDIATLQSCIKYIPISHHKTMSEFLLLKCFGYYLSDAQYSELSNKLLLFSFGWIDGKNRIYAFSTYIFGAFKENWKRINSNRLVEFIIKVLSMDGNRWYDDVCSLSSLINYNFVSAKNQIMLLEKSIEIVEDERKRNMLNRLSQHLIHFRLTATIDIEILDGAIRKNMEEFYNGAYHLEVFDRDRESSIRNVKYYLRSIDIHNEEQGKNGTFHGYGIDPYATICNIIRGNDLALNWDEIRPIIKSAKNTLMAPKQGYQDKCRAILLIVFLKNHFSYTTEWNDLIDSLISYGEKILIGSSLNLLEKDTKHILYIVYQMMLFTFNRSTLDKVISSVISISSKSDYEILKCLEYIDSILDEFDYSKADDLVVTSIIYLASMMTNHRERHVRFFAVKCLIQLTHSKYSSIVLPQLSSVMDTGTSIIKVSIISRVKRIKDSDNSVKDYIIQKGKVDNNYLVRKIASDLTNEA